MGDSSRRRRVAARLAENGGALSPASRLRIAADLHRHSTSDDDSGCVLEEYAWIPSGVKPDMDSDPRYCEGLSREEEEELRTFDKGRKKECLGRGLVQRVPYEDRQYKCRKCNRLLDEGEVCVAAARTNSLYHPSCFKCHQCEALLVDLIYFAHGTKLFCGRHHAEQLKPRCAKCDELIFGEECTEAEGRTWHLHHFQCNECQDVLGGKKYMQRDGRPVCLQCFHNTKSAETCVTCRTAISMDEPCIMQGRKYWHADANCFRCCVCCKNLLGRKYSLVDDSLYCGYNACAGDDDEPHGYMKSPQLPAPIQKRRPKRLPRPLPPQRAPPQPPSENIYETVLPTACASGLSDLLQVSDKSCCSSAPQSPHSSNYYSRTPNRRQQQQSNVDPLNYSTSSSDSEDDMFYINQLMQAATINKIRSQQLASSNEVKLAKKKKSSRCIVS
ncbi:hypothetical protein WR25_21531 [Diploscapter pachys]|uniref:LIM zinc-binding domain-containing protein n=1 Tax=Diploscapter pachys TaxID=2018661 RepID=A0A2A2KRU7_9BILA|nr:hypothetical protein WR25_21531 [Diploscapter pachys]